MKIGNSHAGSRTLKDYAGLAARGFAMGAADVVPGVSGGTMALILGIYEELIDSIRAVDGTFFKLVVGLKLKAAWDKLPWKFLGSVMLGIGLAIVSLARLLSWLLEHHPALIWSFFFGLVLASVLMVSKQIQHWSSSPVVIAILATIGAYFLVGAVPVQTPDAPWFLFLSGAVAICAMILPGISGAFILVLLGKYQHVLNAVNQRELLTLLLVAAGAAVGIVTFAQILGWLFKRYHDLTIALLTGLMLGSLRKLWPWKETLATIIDRHGDEIPVAQANILPGAWTAEVAVALGLAVLGFIAVTSISAWAGRPEGG
jgi:putative membrane protein